MANLLQTIQQNRQALTQPVGVQDETQSLQGLLRAKTGKATGIGDSSISNLGEQQAVAGTNTQLGQVQQAGAVQGQQEQTAAAGIQQQEQEQRSTIDQAKKFDTVQTRLQTQALLSNLQQQKGQLSQQQQAAALEQAAFNLSMQDKRYTDTLQDIGQKRRLDNDLNFKNEMQNLAFGDANALLKERLGNNDILSASDRDFQKTLSSLSIEDAVKIAQIQAAGARTASDAQNSIARQAASTANTQSNLQTMYGGIGNTLSGALQAYKAYKDSPGNEDSEEESGDEE